MKKVLSNAGLKQLSAQELESATRLQYNANKLRNAGAIAYSTDALGEPTEYLEMVLPPLKALAAKLRENTKPKEQDLYAEFAQLFDAIDGSKFEPDDIVAPAVFSYDPVVEAQWETLAFAVSSSNNKNR